MGKPSSCTMLLQTMTRLQQASRKCFHPNLTRHLCTIKEAKIRPMHPKESSALANCLTSEGARLRNADLQLIHSLDKDGFFLAVSDEGDIVGTIGAMRLSDDHGFIGFNHVNEDYANKGYEEKLLVKAMEYLGDRNIGMEVAVSDVELCEELGFKEEWRNGRFQGVGVALPPQILVNPMIHPLAGMAMGKLVDYDTTVTGVQKVQLVLGWCKAPSTGFAAVTDGKVMGYGVIHPMHNPTTHRIAPLLTDNVGIAQIILLTLLSTVPKQKVFLDSPVNNVSFTRLLTSDLKMEQIGETVRMYTKGNPGFSVKKCYGVLCPDAGC